MNPTNKVELIPSLPYPGLEKYRVLRSYIEHEDELIHQRLNWVLLLEGFLFASFGAISSGILCASSYLNKEPTWGQYVLARTIQHAIPVAGFCIASLSVWGVEAARQSIQGLVEWWEKQAEREFWPSITGGGQAHGERLEPWLPYGIPLVLCYTWTYIQFMSFSVGGDLWKHARWLFVVVSLLSTAKPLVSLCLRVLKFFEKDSKMAIKS